MIRALKALLILTASLALAACDPTRDLEEPPVSLGNFRLGHNIVVVREPQALPGSRNATAKEWETAMKNAIDARFGRYEGGKYYHFGVSVDAYNLAPIDVPGIPTPKSALGATVTVWDDALGRKLNEEGKVITVFGVFSGQGIQPSKQKQLDNLSALAARSIQKWLLENPDWFDIPQEE